MAPTEVVSPELALVDPALAARERRRLVAPADLPAPAPAPARERAPDATFLDAEADAALKRLAASAVEAAPASPRSRRRWELFVAAPALVATIVFAASTQLDEGGGTTDVPANEAATTTASAEPLGPSRRLAWAPSAEAEAYDVEIFRNSDRIFGMRTRAPRVDVPPTWSYAGRDLALDPGEYHWYVWPVVDGKRGASTMVGSTFTVQAP